MDQNRHDSIKADEQGQYKHTFNVPTNWTTGRVIIVFEGAMTDTDVKINGRSAGAVHQGGFYEFRYDITDLVRPGRNMLDVTVSKNRPTGRSTWPSGTVISGRSAASTGPSIWRSCPGSSSSN